VEPIFHSSGTASIGSAFDIQKKRTIMTKKAELVTVPAKEKERKERGRLIREERSITADEGGTRRREGNANRERSGNVGRVASPVWGGGRARP